MATAFRARLPIQFTTQTPRARALAALPCPACPARLTALPWPSCVRFEIGNVNVLLFKSKDNPYD
jgi:hypothetical protein